MWIDEKRRRRREARGGLLISTSVMVSESIAASCQSVRESQQTRRRGALGGTWAVCESRRSTRFYQDASKGEVARGRYHFEKVAEEHAGSLCTQE